MQKEFDKAFKEFYEENLATGAKIEYSDGEERHLLRIEGSLPMLFCGACEIVEQLVRSECKEHPGAEKLYLSMLCDAVLENLGGEEKDDAR